MSAIWDAETYDSARRRLVPCFDEFYGAVVELVTRTAPEHPSILDLGSGTGILAAMLAEPIGPASLHLVDVSAEMLARAEHRLSVWQPTVSVQALTDPLPAGPFGAVVSALAIHHLSDPEKRDLFARVLDALEPGGIFVNAEQILGDTPWEQKLNEEVHLGRARALGSEEEEIAAANQRMTHDRCATIPRQVDWLCELGYEHAGCFFHSFRFAVYAGWKAPSASHKAADES